MANNLAKNFLRRLNGEAIDFTEFDSAVSTLRKQMEEKVAIPTLDKVNSEIEKFRAKIDFTPLTSAFENLKATIANQNTSLKSDLNARLEGLRSELSDARGTNKDSVAGLTDAIQAIQKQIVELSKPIITPDFGRQVRESEGRLKNLIDSGTYDDKRVKEQIADLEKLFKRIREEVNNRGGGSMNRQMFIGGVDPLLKYSDVNLKAGSNVTITYQNNETTKKVDITISATGGGGGSSRLIQSIAVSQPAGSTAGIDYVYLCSGTLTLTMPTTVGNTNLYTIKNIGAGIVTINTTGGETIDSDSTVIMPVQYTSVDLVSNNSGNWNIT